MDELLDRQHGVVARRQLLALGWSAAAVEWQVGRGRLLVVQRGVYTTRAGPPTDHARAWAAVLVGGEGAALGGASALWAGGAVDRLPTRPRVDVPANRRVRQRPGVLLRVNQRLSCSLHPSAEPPRVRVEDALLDELDLVAREGAVVDLLTTVVQRRVTTPERLLPALRRRARHRWRALAEGVCRDLEEGVHSRLERQWCNRVERPHRLPRGRRNVREVVDGATVYRDVLLQGPGMTAALLVELDGELGHLHGAFRDRRRDNRATVSGRTHLRYGWHEVVGTACEVADECARVLVLLGWSGWVAPCSPGCRVGVRPAT